jgi:hypothetical protein
VLSQFMQTASSCTCKRIATYKYLSSVLVMVPRRADGRRSKRCLCLGSFACGAVISELLVLRYLHSRWPLLEHPISPPTNNLGDAADSRPLRNLDGDKSDLGEFGGVPVVYRQGSRPPVSSVHCIGENFEADAWKYRSCRYENLCYDRQDKEFVYLQSSREATLVKSYQQNANNKFITVSTIAYDNAAVSLGQVNQQTTPTEMKQTLQWIPKIKRQSDFSPTGYFELASNAVLIPFTSYDGIGVDVYFTFFTLLSSFGSIDQDSRPVFMELYTSSELTCSSAHCFGIHKPSLPLFGLFQNGGSGSNGSFLAQERTARLVCAKQAVAGIGKIADRGLNPLGKEISSTPNSGVTINMPTHNLAQGKLLQGFRDFVLRNVGVESLPKARTSSLVVSWYDKASAYNTDKVREQLKRASSHEASEFLELGKLEPKTFRAAATSIAKSRLLLVMCCTPEAALASTLLPHESTLVVYYDSKEFGGKEAAKRAIPIWDLIDSAAYFKAHWIPLGAEEDSTILVVQKLQRQGQWNQAASR